jgi:hypothetical protein
MPYQLEDIAEVLDKLGTTEREDGETAFPSVAKILKRLGFAESRRKRAEQELKEELERQEKRRLYEEDVRLNPEKHAALDREYQENLARLERKFGFAPKPTPTPPPVMTSCPHCEKPLPLAAGIRLMTAKEVQDMGHLMEQMEAQAAERREANRIHAEKCIEAELAKANAPGTSDSRNPNTETK